VATAPLTHGPERGYDAVTVSDQSNPWRLGDTTYSDDTSLVNALFDVAPGLHLVLDVRGRVLRMSRDWEGVVGLRSDLAIGRAFSDLLSPTDRDTHEAAWQQALNTGEAQRFEHAYQRSSGQVLRLAWHVQRVGDAVLAAARDLSPVEEAQRRAQGAIMARERSERFFKSVVDAQSDLIVRVDADHRFTFVNEAYCRTFGRRADELLGTTFTPLVHDDDLAGTLAAMASLRHPPHHCDLVQRAWTVDGWRWIAWHDQAFVDEHGAIVEIQGVGRDISDLKAAESSVHAERLRMAETNELAGVARWDFDYQRQHLAWSAGVHALFETDPETFVPTYEGFLSLVHPLDRPYVASANQSAVRERRAYDIEHRIITARGRLRWVHQRASVSFAADGLPEQAVGIIQDISKRKLFDPLTGLANLHLLNEQLDGAVTEARHRGTSVALCSLDIDRFAEVNARFGRDTGDALLRAVAERLRRTLRSSDLVARAGGDEFMVLLPQLNDANEARHAAEIVAHAFDRPFALDDATVQVSASVGVAIHPLDDTPSDTLRRQADHAMQDAKAIADQRVVVYDQAVEIERRARQLRRERLTQALQCGELALAFQPTVRLATGAISGAEALVRWRHPEEGLLAPDRFLPDIMGTDLEIALGRWVLTHAFEQWALWRDAGIVPSEAVLGINVSARHLLENDFVADVRDALAAHPNVPSHSVQLEVLESSALVDLDRARAVLTHCRSLGVSTALDDFGTGYSSLSHFRRLPIDVLKIDRSFVGSMLVDPDDLGIVNTVLALGRAFNRTVCAEGAETLEQAATLRALGCDQLQGYVVSRPLTAHDFAAWLSAWDGEQLVQQLERQQVVPAGELGLWVAGQSHRRWAARVRACASNVAALEVPNLDAQHCAFGTWYFGAGSASFGGHTDYVALETEHEDVHHQAQALIERVQRGEALGDELERFETAHRALLSRLERLRESLTPPGSEASR